MNYIKDTLKDLKSKPKEASKSNGSGQSVEPRYMSTTFQAPISFDSHDDRD